jgi:uncharacterized membrane protein YdjX (TVP38/TMEM64 family)
MTRRHRVIGSFVVLAVGFALAGLLPLLRRALTDAVPLLARADVGALRGYLLGFGAWAPLVSAGLMILQAVVAPLPASPITYVNGLVFGTWSGGLLSWASALVAAAISFSLSRRLGRPIAERLVTRRALEWSDAFVARFGPRAVLISRLLPMVPFDVVSYGAGARVDAGGDRGARAVRPRTEPESRGAPRLQRTVTMTHVSLRRAGGVS